MLCFFRSHDPAPSLRCLRWFSLMDESHAATSRRFHRTCSFPIGLKRAALLGSKEFLRALPATSQFSSLIRYCDTSGRPVREWRPEVEEHLATQIWDERGEAERSGAAASRVTFKRSTHYATHYNTLATPSPLSPDSLRSPGSLLAIREPRSLLAIIQWNLSLVLGMRVKQEKSVIWLFLKVALHGIKGFVIPTKSFVKIGVAKIFCHNNKMFSSINKTFGYCSKIFGCSSKKNICCP